MQAVPVQLDRSCLSDCSCCLQVSAWRAELKLVATGKSLGVQMVVQGSFAAGTDFGNQWN